MAEARKIRYVGAHAEVYVPALGQSVRRNHQISVDDAALAAALLEQSGWEEVGAKAREAQRGEPADAAPAGGG